MKLYELAEAYKNVLDLLENEEVDQEMLQQALENVEAEIEEKVENIVKIIKNLEGDVEIIKKEERLYNKRKTLENKIEWIKAYTFNTLNSLGLNKIKTKIFNIGIQNNVPSVEVLDESQIPEKYFRIEKVLLKKEILNDLKQGQEIPGVGIKVTQSLRIR